MRATRVVGGVSIALGIGLIGAIVASSLEMGIVAGVRSIVATGWGATTLLDAYIGLVFVGVWIACIERRAGVAAAWFIALMLTGNIATVVYVAVRSFRASTVREVFIGPPTRELSGRAAR